LREHCFLNFWLLEFCILLFCGGVRASPTGPTREAGSQKFGQTMKTYRNLYPQIATFAKLSPFALERELLRLERELQNETWRPGGYTSFYITDPNDAKSAPRPSTRACDYEQSLSRL
jgi:hypothetical protein